MMSGNTKARLKWLDIAKEIGMAFIILSHASGERNGWIGNIYLPFYLAVFFFSSGYLFKDTMTLKEECIYVVRHLVIPWLSFGMINAVVATIIEHENLLERIVGLVLQTSDGYSDIMYRTVR